MPDAILSSDCMGDRAAPWLFVDYPEPIVGGAAELLTSDEFISAMAFGWQKPKVTKTWVRSSLTTVDLTQW